MKKYYLIDHRILFLFGFAFYLIVPYVIGTAAIFQGYPGVSLYQSFFSQIPAEKLSAYIQLTLAWVPAFFLGHFAFTFFIPAKRELNLFPPSAGTRGTGHIGLILFVLLLLFTWSARHSLFAGYSSYDVAARGKLSTLLVICNFFLLYQLISRQKLSYLVIFCTGAAALLLLSMGGRMYVFQTFIIILIYKTSFASRRWSALQILLAVLVAFLAGAIAGIWRLGASFSPSRAAYSFLAEPLFTWFSTSTFLISNEIPVINMPWNFLTSFINLIPNSVVNVQQFVVPAQAMGYTYQSPLGADSIWTNYIINFGWAGSLVFIFITGFLLNLLRHLSERSRFWAVYYILVCGMLPFQFFRDGFYIINKQLFFNFLLFPAAILALFKTVVYLQTISTDKGQLKGISA